MRLFSTFLSILILGACSFAPIAVGVPDFEIVAGSSSGDICYTRADRTIDVNFRRVFYEGDATYTPGQGIGDNSTVDLAVYGRASDPDPSSTRTMKCVSQSAEDILLQDNIELEAGVTQRIAVGGAELADLVTEEAYWLGGSLSDNSIVSFPGRISFTDGKVKAYF